MVLQCSYGRSDDNISCLNKKELDKMAKKAGITISGNKEKIYKALLNHYNAKNDLELIKKNKEFNINNVLKPPTPGFYLSNTEIDSIFKQFSDTHSEFMSYGGVPYDFWKRPSGSWENNCDKIYNFDIKKFENGGKRKWGMITNLSNSNHSGSHWVCMYFELNVKNKTSVLEYFDSIGTNKCRSNVVCTKENIPVEIMKFINIIKKNCEDNGYKFKFTFNEKQHQKENNECGMYCIYYIMNRIKGEKYSDMTDIPDEKMTYLRSVLFRSPHYCWDCKKYKKSIIPLIKKYS